MEIKEKIPIMTYSQYRRARKLVHQCCNYESGRKYVQIDLYFTYVGQIRIPLKIGRESLNESEPA